MKLINMNYISFKSTILGVLGACLLLASFSSCDEFEDERLDFSNSFPAFVEFTSSSDLEVNEDTTISVAIRIPPTIYQEVLVNYEVSGAFSATGSGTIPSGVLNGAVSLTIPTGVIPDGAESAEAIITLTGADNGIVVGRNGQGNISRTLIVNP